MINEFEGQTAKDITRLEDTKNDVEELYINLQDIQGRSPLKMKLENLKGSLEKPGKKTSATCTQERKEKHRHRMEIWKARKNGENSLN